MGKGKKSKKSKRSRRAAEDDVEAGGAKAGGVPVPKPLILGFVGLEAIFGIVFIIIGSLNVNKCNISPFIPIWLILMGIVYIFTAVHEYNEFRLSMNRTYQGRGFISLILTGSLTLVTIGLFIAGNVFVYQAWGVSPDYGHYWFENGCNMSAYMLSFVGVIVMDVLFGLLLLGILIFAAFSCLVN